jgi:membrane associated rhomboid family serine protease
MSVFRRSFRYQNNNMVFVLIGLNILVFLAEWLFGQRFLRDYLAMIPKEVLNGRVWTFVTYMFLHSGFRHIFFNMFALFIFGVQVERYIGSRDFLLYYFVTGILAGVFSFGAYLFAAHFFFPYDYYYDYYYSIALMGASGAIFAIQLAYAVFFPQSIIYIWGILPLRAPVMVLGFTALEIVMMVTGMGGNVAHVTHLAGFGFGWLYFRVRFGISPWRRLTGR